MEIDRSEKLRALNMIWNAAKDYSILPSFKVYDARGRADIYWNSIIGAVYRHFDFSRIEALFRSFEGDASEYQLKNLLWLGLESAAYFRERGERPVLDELRLEYARAVLAERPKPDPLLFERVQRASCALIAGERPDCSEYCLKLCELLSFSADMDTEMVIARAKEIFSLYLHFEAEEKAKKEEAAPESGRSLHIPFLRLGKKGAQRGGEGRASSRLFASGSAEYSSESGSDPESINVRLSAFNMRSEDELRAYMENFFGASVYNSSQLSSMEKELCSGRHSGCHLHFTRGVFKDKKGFKGKDDYLKMSALRQRDKNRAYYEERRTEAEHHISSLASRIRNSMLTHLQSSAVKSNSGILCAGRVWREEYLNDMKIFQKELKGECGELSVDILLDASSSQAKRQERLATQAYIIAESLSRCAIPVRLYSFCSLRGFTVFRIFRDYNETDKNAEVFNYFTSGCNRDGLALRVSHDMLLKSPYEHKLLIILSDVRPNGVQRVRTENGEYKNYSDELAVRDTAAELRSAERDGISVLCVFTGEEDALPSAKLIYGTGFTRIKELEHFADAVGTLIQEEIKNL